MLNRIKKFAVGLAVALIPSPVFAAPPQLGDAFLMVERLFAIFIPVGALLATLMIVWGGYTWMMSNGDPSKIKQAQGTLTWSILGLVFLGIFRMILTLVFGFLAS
jgi:hypothetical protein